MELTINIDEKEFTKLLEGELKNFSEQELHMICRDALIKQLSDPDTFASMFVRKESGWGYSDRLVATSLLETAAKTVDLSPLFKDFQEQVVNYLKENHNKIIKQLMADIFVSGFSQYLYNSNFMQDMRISFNQALDANNRQQEERLANALSNLNH